MKLILFFILSTLFISGCKKDKPADSNNTPICKSKDCAEVNISGRIFDKTNNAGSYNHPINILWHSKFSWFSSSTNITSGKSDANGNFYFKVSIDTTFFHGNFLKVRIPLLANYITIPFTSAEDSEYAMSEYSPNYQQLNFEFYPKATLIINLHRTLKDTFEYFSVEHWFIDGLRYSDRVIVKKDSNNIVINTETSADIYTKIKWMKTFGLGQFTKNTDSVIFKRNETNVYDIYW